MFLSPAEMWLQSDWMESCSCWENTQNVGSIDLKLQSQTFSAKGLNVRPAGYKKNRSDLAQPKRGQRLQANALFIK